MAFILTAISWLLLSQPFQRFEISRDKDVAPISLFDFDNYNSSISSLQFHSYCWVSADLFRIVHYFVPTKSSLAARQCLLSQKTILGNKDVLGVAEIDFIKFELLFVASTHKVFPVELGFDGVYNSLIVASGTNGSLNVGMEMNLRTVFLGPGAHMVLDGWLMFSPLIMKKYDQAFSLQPVDICTSLQQTFLSALSMPFIVRSGMSLQSPTVTLISLLHECGLVTETGESSTTNAFLLASHVPVIYLWDLHGIGHYKSIRIEGEKYIVRGSRCSVRRVTGMKSFWLGHHDAPMLCIEDVLLALVDHVNRTASIVNSNNTVIQFASAIHLHDSMGESHPSSDAKIEISNFYAVIDAFESICKKQTSASAVLHISSPLSYGYRKYQFRYVSGDIYDLLPVIGSAQMTDTMFMSPHLNHLLEASTVSFQCESSISILTALSLNLFSTHVTICPLSIASLSYWIEKNVVDLFVSIKLLKKTANSHNDVLSFLPKFRACVDAIGELHALISCNEKDCSNVNEHVLMEQMKISIVMSTIVNSEVAAITTNKLEGPADALDMCQSLFTDLPAGLDSQLHSLFFSISTAFVASPLLSSQVHDNAQMKTMWENLSFISPSHRRLFQLLLSCSETAVTDIKSSAGSTLSVRRNKKPFVPISNAFANAHVLVFVNDENGDENGGRSEMEVAQEIAQSWREHCELQSCHFYTRYSVLPVTVHNKKHRGKVPLRAVLAATAEWIRSFATRNDIIIVLAGLQAAWSFEQPGRVNGTSLIPDGKYGDSTYFRLDSPLLFGARSDAVGDSGGNGDNIDPYSFAGVASDMLVMIDEVLHQQFNSMFTSVTDAIISYVATHSVDIKMDVNYSTFRRHCTEEEVRATPCSYTFQNSEGMNVESGLLTLFRYPNISRPHTLLHHFGSWDSSEHANERSDISPLVPLLDPLGQVNTIALEAQYNLTFSELQVGHLLAATEVMLHVVNQLSHTNFAFAGILSSFELGKAARLVSYLISQYEMETVVDLLEAAYVQASLANAVNDTSQVFPWRQNDERSVAASSFRLDKIAILSALSAMYQETSRFDRSVYAFVMSISPPSYAEVSDARQQWSQHKQCYLNRRTSPSGQHPKQSPQLYNTHYITVASHHTKELDNLLFSAKVSGIEITVLGLDKTYVHYGNKLLWCYEHLSNAMNTLKIKENDVIVFMDAYDVLVFPSIRSIADQLYESPTPIVFCAENGLYPEFSGAWTYAEGSRVEKDGTAYLGARYLNSGCYIGRAVEVVQMLYYAVQEADYIRDDQQILTRFALSNAHLVSVDYKNHFFRTAFMEFQDIDFVGMNIGFSFMEPVGGIRLLHFNNKGSSGLYDILSQAMRTLFDLCYERTELSNPTMSWLKALHAIIDGNFDLATSILYQFPSPNIRVNAETDTRYVNCELNHSNLKMVDQRALQRDGDSEHTSPAPIDQSLIVCYLRTILYLYGEASNNDQSPSGRLENSPFYTLAEDKRTLSKYYYAVHMSKAPK